MSKVMLDKKMPTLALPICLVGANVEGKPNFCAIAWFTIIDDEPPMVGLVMAKESRTKDGINEKGTFSVNIPSASMAAATDYCGLYSGYEVDKSEVFKVYYGALGTAPMIEECPLAMECELRKIVEFEATDLVIGEIAEVHIEESCLKRGKPDLKKIDPLMYGMSGGGYFTMGEKVADAYKVGKDFKKKRTK